MYDVVVVGAGPAGLSAAINAKQRGRSVLIVSNNPVKGHLAKAHVINNYLGMLGTSGIEMINTFVKHAESAGVDLTEGRVINVVPFGESFMVNTGNDAIEAQAVVLAFGAVIGESIPGEKEYLGRGVSYCATCDGMLYRGKKVAVVGGNSESVAETRFLSEIGCDVAFYSKKNVEGLPDGVIESGYKNLAVQGDEVRAQTLVVDGKPLAYDGIFFLRDTIPPDSLLEGLQTDGPYIKVDRHMRTNIPGVFAAGDCAGEPRQVAKAVGEGLIAGLGAAERGR